MCTKVHGFVKHELQARSASEWIGSTRWRFVLLTEKMFARREDFAVQLNPQADWGIGHRNVWRIGEDRKDRNDGGTIVILLILPIHSDPERHRRFWVDGRCQRQATIRKNLRTPRKIWDEGYVKSMCQ